MEHSRRTTSNKPKNYAKIPLNTRINLVKLITQELLSLAKASNKLSIKLSTAKLIMKRYRQEGTFFEKRSDRIIYRRNIQQENQNDFPSNATPNLQIAQRTYGAQQNQQNFELSQYSNGLLFYADNAYNCMQNSNAVPFYYWGYVDTNTMQYNYIPHYCSKND